MNRGLRVLAACALTSLAGMVLDPGLEGRVSADQNGGGSPTSADAFVAWAQGAAVPIASTDLTAASMDLEPFINRLAEGRLIGLGEATHGTHEFFALKARMIAALAARGLNEVLFEAGLADTFPVDDYVLGGPGDAEAVVHGMAYWTWDTTEVVDLVKWLRAWNAAHRPQIHFRGIDMNFPRPGLDCVNRFAAIWKIPLKLPDAAEAPFLYAAQIERAYSGARRQDLDRVRAWFDKAGREMDGARGEVTTRSGTAAFDAARQCLEVARQSHELNMNQALRDGFLATNTLWWLQQAGPESKAVLWAHNAHVRADTDRMGATLRRQLGSRYVPVGLFFGQGEFRSNLKPVSGDRFWEWVGPSRVWRIGPSSSKLLEATLDRVGLPEWAIDLRAAPDSGLVSSFLAGRHTARSIGSIVDPLAVSSESYSSLRAAFDGLVFAANATAARPTGAAWAIVQEGLSKPRDIPEATAAHGMSWDSDIKAVVLIGGGVSSVLLTMTLFGWVLARIHQASGPWNTAAAALFAPYAWFWGWRHAPRQHMVTIMIVWTTAALATGVLLRLMTQ